MAKLHNYCVLCPLIDQKSFLGVSPDKEDGCLIVTLGRNVANRYRLSDQKQVGGWTSKDHITSTVVYDKHQDSYVGVFNNKTIKMWKEDGDNLDKSKKYKFPKNILKIVTREDQPSIIVFNNGNCAALPYAIENRKTYDAKSLLKDSEHIIDTACYTFNGIDNIAYVVKNKKDVYEIINCPIRHELGDMEKSKLSRIKIHRSDNVYVVGELINTHDKDMVVYVLWSDSKLSAFDLTKNSWKTVGTVPWISTVKNVSLAWMAKDHLILFGSNSEQDGAVLFAYNVVLGVGSCKFPMKMYTADAKLYCVNESIVLEASNHIAVLPYVLEIKRNLARLLGSHEVAEDEAIEFAQWDPRESESEIDTPESEISIPEPETDTPEPETDTPEPETDTPEPEIDLPEPEINIPEPEINISEEINDLIARGIPERSLAKLLLRPLLRENDTVAMRLVLKELQDIPESMLVRMIRHVLRNIDARNADLLDAESFESFCLENFNELEFLNDLLKVTYSDAVLIFYLRDGLSVDDSLFIMNYIKYLILNDEVSLDADFESKLLDWVCILMDAYYQQYVMARCAKVSRVLQGIADCVSTLIGHLYTVSQAIIKLKRYLSGQLEVEFLTYSIEIMEI